MNANEKRVRELRIIIRALEGSHPDEAEKYKNELKQLLGVLNKPVQLYTY